ncbi:MAG: hypothetical protein LBU32_00290 [Clostridiales bacterium]|nr:hypothetical protein [Clostridiales bacterium]
MVLARKKFFLAILALAVTLFAASAGTLALLTDKADIVTNTFAIGDIKIRAFEPAFVEFLNTTGASIAIDGVNNKFPILNPSETAPPIPKDPRIENIGSEKAWIRVKADNPKFVAKSYTVLDSMNEINTTSSNGQPFWKVYNPVTNDGFFYYVYSEIVPPNNSTIDPVIQNTNKGEAWIYIRMNGEPEDAQTPTAIEVIFMEPLFIVSGWNIKQPADGAYWNNNENKSISFYLADTGYYWIESEPDENGDVYYYYTKLLDPGEKTEPLFAHIKLNPDYLEDYFSKDRTPDLGNATDVSTDDFYLADINIYAEAVQAAYDSDGKLDADFDLEIIQDLFDNYIASAY